MTGQNVEISYINFKPNISEQKQISPIIDKLYLKSPSDSRLKIELKKLKNSYHGECKILSLNGPFSAEANKEVLHSTLDALGEQIQRQIDNWKSHRFQQSSRAV